jgi:hypothetical protein
MDEQQTPIKEAMSLIAIAAILVSVLCFTAAKENIPILAPALLWIAEVVYSAAPWLANLRSPQIPLVVSALTVGAGFWLLAIPFANRLAESFGRSHMAEMERQTEKLKRNRARIVRARRDRDNFDVS